MKLVRLIPDIGDGNVGNTGNTPSLYLVSLIAGHTVIIITSNHLICDRIGTLYVCANFRGDPRYKNVQGN